MLDCVTCVSSQFFPNVPGMLGATLFCLVKKKSERGVSFGPEKVKLRAKEGTIETGRSGNGVCGGSWKQTEPGKDQKIWG